MSHRTKRAHEANVSCWADLKEKGIVIKIWNVNRETLEYDLEDLKNLLSDKIEEAIGKRWSGKFKKPVFLNIFMDNMNTIRKEMENE